MPAIYRIKSKALPMLGDRRGFVVRARSEQHAREIAATRCGSEGADVWLDWEKSFVTKIESEGNIGVILTANGPH